LNAAGEVALDFYSYDEAVAVVSASMKAIETETKQRSRLAVQVTFCLAPGRFAPLIEPTLRSVERHLLVAAFLADELGAGLAHLDDDLIPPAALPALSVLPAVDLLDREFPVHGLFHGALGLGDVAVA
jgi:hypothetical protein